MSTFEQLAQELVDQHYAAGPDNLKLAVAKALEDAAQYGHEGSGDTRQQLLREVAELEKASERGSE